MTGTVAAPARPERGSSPDAQIIGGIKASLAAGNHPLARERYGDLVARHQRRAARLAFHYLRDAADADEAVQDAFVKAYGRLSSFREELPFHVWFTRILVNGCLDRLKARARRDRWMVRLLDTAGGDREVVYDVPARSASPEQALLARERRQRLAQALERLPERQRTVFVLTHYEGCSPREVSEVTGLQESTVRVHLFRAVRRLRSVLADIGLV